MIYEPGVSENEVSPGRILMTIYTLNTPSAAINPAEITLFFLSINLIKITANGRQLAFARHLKTLSPN
jgi:hypothetical protein